MQHLIRPILVAIVPDYQYNGPIIHIAHPETSLDGWFNAILGVLKKIPASQIGDIACKLIFYAGEQDPEPNYLTLYFIPSTTATASTTANSIGSINPC